MASHQHDLRLRETWSVLARLKKLEVDMNNLRERLPKPEQSWLPRRKTKHSTGEGMLRETDFDSLIPELSYMSTEAHGLSEKLSKSVRHEHIRRKKKESKWSIKRIHWPSLRH